MDGSIELSMRERKGYSERYRSVRPGRLVLLSLADDHSYRQIGMGAIARTTLIAAVKHDFYAGGLARVLRPKDR